MKPFLLALPLVASVTLALAAPTTSPTPPQTSPATPAATSTAPAPTPAPGQRATPIPVTGTADPRAPGYIILLDNTVDAKTEVARLEKLYNFKATHTYDMNNFKGFSATVPADVLEKLRWELTITSIEHDGVASVN